MSQEREVDDADCLKKLDEIGEPDPRHNDKLIFDIKTHEIRLLTIEDFYRSAEELKLHAGVPDEVFVQFEKARNLYLYTWFVYRFGQVAELQAYSTLELALKMRHGVEQGNGLKNLLKDAVDNGWIRDDGFRGYREKLRRRQEHIEMMLEIHPDYANKIQPVKPGSYVRMLYDVLPKMRNTLAHGSILLRPDIHDTLEICCEIINQLFDPREQ